MCDSVVVVRPEAVLFAKNSDRDANEAQLLDWQPAREHAPGSRLRCTWIEIPQAPRTRACLLSRPFWMWGAEMGANADGLVVGNEAVFTRQPRARAGLTGMDLVRLALERAGTVAEACDVIRELIEAHGQGGGCGHEDRGFTYHSSFLIADARGACVLETAGRLHALEAVSGVRSLSNALSIPDFARRHSEPLRTRVCRAALRRARTEGLAAVARGPGDLMRLLRDHGAGRGEPEYAWLTGAMAAPCMHAGGVLAASQTTASWVAELRADGAQHWVTATAAPCTSLFKPVRVDAPLDLGPAPTDLDDGASLWWRHERLHRTALRDPEATLPLFVEERDALEAAWLTSPPQSRLAFVEADSRLAAWTARLPSCVSDRRPAHVRRFWRRREQRAAQGRSVRP